MVCDHVDLKHQVSIQFKKSLLCTCCVIRFYNEMEVQDLQVKVGQDFLFIYGNMSSLAVYKESSTEEDMNNKEQNQGNQYDFPTVQQTEPKLFCY